MVSLPVCEVCGEEETTVTKCKTCGTKFCEYCGSNDDKLCIECMDYKEDDEEGYTEDDDERNKAKFFIA